MTNNSIDKKGRSVVRFGPGEWIGMIGLVVIILGGVWKTDRTFTKMVTKVDMISNQIIELKQCHKDDNAELQKHIDRNEERLNSHASVLSVVTGKPIE